VRLNVLIFLVVCLPVLASAQTGKESLSSSGQLNRYVELYLSTDKSKATSTEDLTRFVQKLESKEQSFKKESDFIQYTFNQTHRKFLKHYKQYCTFTELVDNGTYNCLTATALYALLLDHFNIDYKIVETNYHIFLLANTKQGTILLETTDPIKGFVINADQIQKRISTYKQNELMKADNNKVSYAYQFDLYNVVNLDQLLGLMYYNLAIDAYNHQEIQSSIAYLDQAILRYHSPRIDEFSAIILLTLQESKLEASVKKSYEQKVKAIQTRKLSGVAGY
jgi:hypothetical protein